MTRFFLMCLIGFMTASGVCRAERAEIVSPTVKLVLTSPEVAPNGDFARLILQNSEVSGCITIQKVNLRATPKVVSSNQICEFTGDSKTHSLKGEQAQDVDISNVRWDQGAFQIHLLYAEAAQTAPAMNYDCAINPSLAPLTMQCRANQK